VSQDSGVLATRSANSDSFTSLKELIGNDSVMNFFFEDGIEAFKADEFSGFGTDNKGFAFVTSFTKFDHSGKDVREIVLIN